jgi:cyclopropane fatty-acyl-phospholipid synthase-like methyltransferase
MYDDIVGFYDQIFPLNPGLVKFIQELLPQGGNRILDLGCGPGDMVGMLSSQGYHAIGIDQSEGMIIAAKERHIGEFYPYSFSEINKLVGPFDHIYCVGNSLSYLPNDQYDKFIENVYKLLNVGATFLIQVINWDRFQVKGEVVFKVKPLSDDRTFHRRYDPFEEDKVLFHTWLKKGDLIISEWSDTLYLKTSDFLKEGISQVGMTEVGIYGNYDKDEYIPEDSSAIILAARK